MSADHPDPTAIARTPPDTASTEAPLREELEALGVPAPVIPCREAAAFDIPDGRAWAPDRNVADVIHIPREDVPTGVDAYFPDIHGVTDDLTDGDGESDEIVARLEVSHTRDPFGPTVDLSFGDSVETLTDAVALFWTAVHWARANGIPGVAKEQLGYLGTQFRLGGLYLYAGFAFLHREIHYPDHGERFIEDEDLLAQFRPEGLAPIDAIRDVEPETVPTIDGTGTHVRRSGEDLPEEPSHASAILSQLNAGEDE